MGRFISLLDWELIVVIGIIGILAAIAVPRLTQFTAGAQNTANAATARTIKSAITVIEADPNATLDAATVNNAVDGVTVVNNATPGNNEWGYQIDGGTGAITIYYTDSEGTTTEIDPGSVSGS